MAQRIVLCMGVYCNQGGQAEDLRMLLEERYGPAKAAFMARGADHWERASCLSMCGAGPNCIIYTDDGETVYNHLTPSDFSKILSELT